MKEDFKFYMMGVFVCNLVLGFTSAAVVLEAVKSVSKDQYLLVGIVTMACGAVVQAFLKGKVLNDLALRNGNTILGLEVIAMSSLDLYAAATGDLFTRWLVGGVVASFTSGVSKSTWEHLKSKVDQDLRPSLEMGVGSASQFGTAIGLASALVVSMYLGWSIPTKYGLMLIAVICSVKSLSLIYYLKKYSR